MSSTNHNKNKAHFSGDASEDSGWSSYFDNSVASSNVEDAATCSGSESSSIFSYAAASVGKMHPNDDCVVSARSVAKRRKTRATFIDHDLEDTATSPVCNFEVRSSSHVNCCKPYLSLFPFIIMFSCYFSHQIPNTDSLYLQCRLKTWNNCN